jgi:hypothetical protein
MPEQAPFLPGGKICRLSLLQSGFARLPDKNPAYIREWFTDFRSGRRRFLEPF